MNHHPDAKPPADGSAPSDQGPGLHYFVDISKGVDDASHGTSPSSPWKTIAYAAGLAKPGWTVHVAAGTYGGGLTLSRVGTAAARITFVSDQRWGAKLTGPVIVEGDYTDLVGFDVAGSTTNVVVALTGSFTRAIGNHVHDLAIPCTSSNGGAGIVLDGGLANYTSQGHEVISNFVEGIGSGPLDGSCHLVHGIYASVPGGKIVNNVSIRSAGSGITSWHAATNLIVANNTSAGNGGTGITIGGGDSGVTTGHQNSYVVNNIVYGNALQGITESSDGVHKPANNHYYNNLSKANQWDCISCTTWSKDEVATINVDPLFVDAKNGDYRLQASSPAINSGTSQHAPASDFDGKARPYGAGFDRGAYEWRP